LASKNRGIDVAKNLKIIEWLKAEMVDSVGALFKALLKTGNDAAADALAAIIIVAYLLGKRVGVSFIPWMPGLKLSLWLISMTAMKWNNGMEISLICCII